MLEKLANVFRVPDLRKRIVFTLGLLAVYRLGGHIPTPGINADVLSQFFDQNRGTLPRIHRPVQRRPTSPLDDLCPRHHAVHHGVDHPAVDDGGL